jgi:hypothetical protein
MSWLPISSKLVLPLIVSILILASPAVSQPALSITVSTDRARYTPGENVAISGAVLDNQSKPVFGAGVSIQVNDPGNNVVQVQLLSSDQSGSYSETLSLPTNSPMGQYIVYASASKPGYSNGQSQAQFSVLIQTTSSISTLTTPPTTISTTSSATTSSDQTTSLTLNTTTSSSSSLSTATNNPPKCLIATATYGSEIAPEVTLLRNFRDYAVLRTSAGEGFMRVFNAFYYSFSPGVSSFITSHDLIRTEMKIILYPLIDILYVSSLVFAATSYDGEVAVTTAGILASLTIGIIYLGPILTISSRLLKSHSSPLYAIRAAIFLEIASMTGLFLAEFFQLTVLFEITTVGVVLSNIALGGLLVPWGLTLIRSLLRK